MKLKDIIRNIKIIRCTADPETEIGGVATVPEQQNKGFCKALISEMAFTDSPEK